MDPKTSTRVIATQNLWQVSKHIGHAIDICEERATVSNWPTTARKGRRRIAALRRSPNAFRHLLTTNFRNRGSRP